MTALKRMTANSRANVRLRSVHMLIVLDAASVIDALRSSRKTNPFVQGIQDLLDECQNEVTIMSGSDQCGIKGNEEDDSRE